MDNDKKYVKYLKSIIRDVGFKYYYHNIHVLSPSDGNEYIKHIINSNLPTMVARAGAVEMRCIKQYLNKKGYSDSIREEVTVCAGVFPNNNDFLDSFSEYYIKCMNDVDLLALWNVGAEPTVVKNIKNKNNITYTRLKALEPYYFDDPWSYELKDKKVLIIHPFIDSIKNQYNIREKLFINKNILPKFKTIELIKAVQSNAGVITDFNTWFDSLKYMEDKISKVDFDVAIIGAGAYSLPLASYVKSLGKIGIQMSGATQILFGIKGKRWEQIPEVSCLFNEYWKRPYEHETPKNNTLVEGGSYW